MSLPYFYIESFEGQQTLVLNEDNSRHVAGVLRMKEGEALRLTDGKGHSLQARIVSADRKKCAVEVVEVHHLPRPAGHTIAISLLRQPARFEWFVEKATEMGIRKIIPLVCERTEKQKFRRPRLEGILVSAMLQSQQVWLPDLPDPLSPETLMQESLPGFKYIAHCEGSERISLGQALQKDKPGSSLILIGPEGDFTGREVELATEHEFTEVSLGTTRLRTETAGVVAAALLREY